MTNEQPTASSSSHAVPEKKQTILGLYVTAQEAYEMWKAAPADVHLIDVRTPEEYIFVGHTEMAQNIPLLFIKYAWNTEKDEPDVAPNPEFGPRVMSMFKPTDTIMVMCRSGGRSALAANALAKAGFETVYNIIDGFEGDKVKDPDSAYDGKRLKNGWKNAGAPWTYNVAPELIWTSEHT